MQQHKSNGDQNQQWAARLMNQPYGQWLLIVAAFTIAGIGFYQIWYGISEKYTKHVQGLNLQSQTSAVLLRAGKTGYIARGLVWLVISYLLLRAAIHVNPQEAGDTGKAFRFIEASSFGSYTLAALGLGLIAYGFFNFI